VKTCSEVLLFDGGVAMGKVDYREYGALEMVLKKISQTDTTSTTTSADELPTTPTN
jgi:hypothetical protein